MNGKEMMLVACVLGAAAVGIAATGSHMVKVHISADDWANFKTASQYHFIHSLLVLFAGHFYKRNETRKLVQWSGYFLISGMILFCFPMYTHHINADSWIIYLAPFGGLFLMIGWLLMGIGVVMKPKQPVKSGSKNYSR